MVSITGYRDAYKLDIPMQWPMAMAMAMMSSERKQFRTRYWTSANMATELVLKEMEHDHRAYRMVYRMASQETVEITTKKWSSRSHSVGYHCRRTSHGDRTRGLPGAQADKATDGDAYRMAYQMIKKLSPNGIPNGMPNHLTRGLRNDYREANGYSTEAAYLDSHREVN